MTSHWDALITGVALFAAYLALLAVAIRAYRRQRDRIRAQRDAWRAECADLREQLAAERARTLRRTTRPVRTPLIDAYALERTVADVPGPYTPVFYGGGA